jgi:Family of unknown function (DUF5317)
VLLILGAIVLGILVGLVTRGSFQKLSELRFRAWWLALVGLALQFVPVPTVQGQIDHWLGVGLLMSSYAVLLLFVALNLRLPGTWLVGMGFALNLLVIVVNGGMPVNQHALQRAYGPSYGSTLHQLLTEGGAKHHLARPDDVLLPLSDVIPVPRPVGNVFSAGDFVSLVGIVWLLASATRGHRGRVAVVRPNAGDGSAVRPANVAGEPAAHPPSRSGPPSP